MAEGSADNGEPCTRPFSLYIVNQFVDEQLQVDLSERNESPFKSLECLLRRPAYLAMFLKHLHESRGSEATVPLLFLLRCGSYYHITKGLEDGKDAKRQAQSIIHTFLSQNSPWNISVDPVKLEEMDTMYRKKEMDLEEAISLFHPLARDVSDVVSAQLSAYQKTLKAEDDDETLQEDLERSSEYQVTQKILNTVIPSSSFTAQDGAYAMLLTSMALAMGLEQKCSFLEKLSNVQQKGVLSASPSTSLFMRGKGKHQVHIIAGHNFVATHYNSPTFCDYCNGLLWGIGNQGYTCQLCNYNVHKATCNMNISEYCRGEPKEGANSLFRRGSLKPSFSGSFRQGIRPSSSRCSVETDVSECGDGTATKRSLAPLPSGGVNSISSTSDTGSMDTNLSDRSSVASGPHGSIYALRRGVSNAQVQASDSRTSSQKILRAQSMKITNASEKKVVQAQTGSAGSGSRRSIDGTNMEPALLLAREEVLGGTVNATTATSNDPDLNVDEELIPWSIRETDAVAGMEKNEIKRQDLCHELVHTEKTHVKKLKVLYHVFYRSLMQSEVFPSKLVEAVFPGLHFLINFHVDLMHALKNCLDTEDHSKAKGVGGVLVEWFKGEKGDHIRELGSEWVKLRQANLDFLKHFSTKQPKVAQLITQCEASPLCARLKLPDLTSVVMQRFTKYPLLLESIQKVTDDKLPEYILLSRAIDLSKGILAQINGAVMDFENNRSLFELQARIEFKNMDRLTGPLAAYRSLDVSNRELIHRGDLKWKQKGKLVSVNAILFPDILILLEHNEDKTRHYLRVREDHPPVVTLKDLLPPREVASDKERKSFLLVWLTQSGSRMYELSTTTSDQSEKWRLQISNAIAASKGGPVSVTSSSYSKNIKAYMMRTHINYTRSMSAQDTMELLDTRTMGDEDCEEAAGCLTPRSSMEHINSVDEGPIATASAVLASMEAQDMSERVASANLPNASPARPSNTAGRPASVTPEPENVAAVPSTQTNGPLPGTAPASCTADLVTLLESCIGQVSSLSGLAQDSLKEVQSRGRSIRAKSSIGNSPSSARLFSAIESLQAQLHASLDLAKLAAEQAQEVKNVGSTPEKIAMSKSSGDVSSATLVGVGAAATAILDPVKKITDIMYLSEHNLHRTSTSPIKKNPSKKDLLPRRFTQLVEEPSFKRSWSDTPTYINARANVLKAIDSMRNPSGVTVPHLSVDSSAAQRQQPLSQQKGSA